MDIILLVLAGLAFLVRVEFVHLVLMLVHGLCALWIVRRWITRRPLMCLFILAYVAMYFPNPIAVMLGWVPLEFETSHGIFMISNAMQMLGLDLFLVATLRLRSHRFDLNRMPQLVLNPIMVEVCIIGTIAVCTITIVSLISTVSELRVNIFMVSKSWRASYGEHNAAYLMVSYAFMLLPVATFLIMLKRFPAQVPYWIPMAVLLATFFMIMRNRTAPIAVLLALIVGGALRNRLVTLAAARPSPRFPRRLKLFLVAALPTLLVAGIGGKYLRRAYTLRDYRFGREEWQYLMEHTFAGGGDLSFAMFLRHAIRLFPSQHELLKGQSYYRVLFMPIPRFAWPTKPENTERYFAAALDPSLRRKNVTIPAGLVGDTYINFGYPGIILLFFYGWAWTREKYRGLTNVLFLSGSGIWMFHFVRGNFSNSLLAAFIVWLFASLCTRLIKPRWAHPRSLPVPPPASPATQPARLPWNPRPVPTPRT